MLIHIDPSRSHIQIIEGAAHMVVSINQAGETSLRSFFCDRTDATYAALSDDRLLQLELPRLLDELRIQIQSSSGSAVTE